jgi:hypothetical protein
VQAAKVLEIRARCPRGLCAVCSGRRAFCRDPEVDIADRVAYAASGPYFDDLPCNRLRMGEPRCVAGRVGDR